MSKRVLLVKCNNYHFKKEGNVIKNAIVRFLIFFAILFAAGGWVAVGQGLEVFGTVFKGFFPIFFEVAKQSLEDYLTSPYFITGVIMSIASAFGIWFAARGGRVLFLVISIICEIISLTSILMNVI